MYLALQQAAILASRQAVPGRGSHWLRSALRSDFAEMFGLEPAPQNLYGRLPCGKRVLEVSGSAGSLRSYIRPVLLQTEVRGWP